MPLANGLEVLTSLGQMGIATRIVVLAAAASDSEVHSLISAGVSGLLFKDSAATELLACIKAVAEGKRWYSPSIVDSLTRHEQHGMAWLSSLATLTPRERRVATLVGLGRSNKEIAFELDLSEGTVKIHLHSIFRKLGLTKRAELVTLSADVDEPR